MCSFRRSASAPGEWASRLRAGSARSRPSAARSTSAGASSTPPKCTATAAPKRSSARRSRRRCGPARSPATSCSSSARSIRTTRAGAGTAAACERSLARLGLDYLDAYLLHWRGSVALQETVDAFEALRSRGRIRHWGVSNFDLADMTELMRVRGGDRCATNQIYYSLSTRGPAFDLVPWLQRHGIATMAYSPIDQGALARNRALARLASKLGATPAQIALAWLTSQPGRDGDPQGSERGASAREPRVALADARCGRPRRARRGLPAAAAQGSSGHALTRRRRCRPRPRERAKLTAASRRAAGRRARRRHRARLRARPPRRGTRNAARTGPRATAPTRGSRAAAILASEALATISSPAASRSAASRSGRAGASGGRSNCFFRLDMIFPSSREGSGAAFASGDVFHRVGRNGAQVRGRERGNGVSHDDSLVTRDEQKAERPGAVTRPGPLRTSSRDVRGLYPGGAPWAAMTVDRATTRLAGRQDGALNEATVRNMSASKSGLGTRRRRHIRPACRHLRSDVEMSASEFGANCRRVAFSLQRRARAMPRSATIATPRDAAARVATSCPGALAAPGSTGMPPRRSCAASGCAAGRRRPRAGARSRERRCAGAGRLARGRSDSPSRAA